MKRNQGQTSQSSFQNKTLQFALLASFALATILLGISHRAVTTYSSSANDAVRIQLLSVPLPPSQRIRSQANANGELPPIPKFEKQNPHDAAAEENGKRNKNKDEKGGLDSASTPSFPLPSDAVPAGISSSEVIVQPTFGDHRSTNNAVFAFAEGYDLNVYVTFIESLTNTGFRGDVVLSVSHVEGMKSGVQEYLEWYSQGEDSIRVISYALPWECYKKSGVRILPTNNEGRGSTTNNGFSDCKINGLYSDGTDNALAPADDPREARPVATARYELYWIWSRQYQADSSIFIIDVRDTYFQSNPFTSRPSPGGADSSANKASCMLDLYEENYEAVNIGKSSYNSKWIKTAYGQKALKEIQQFPVICSGSTMGSQHAIELYTKAMVAQFDDTKCKQVGCDQGFHNYLFYKGELKPYLASHACIINVHKQGESVVNNLAAMRNSPLRSQGVLQSFHGRGGSVSARETIVVLNNDNSTLSPVLHQFDRDKELKGVIRQRTSEMLSQWKARKMRR